MTSYKDVVKNYDEYLRLQANTFKSFESTALPYHAGILKAYRWFFGGNGEDVADKRVLDAACGDGFQTRMFVAHGAKVVGVELSEDKAAEAQKSGAPVHVLDFHDLSMFEDHSFDVVFSSHSLEHAYDPGLVLDNFYRVLTPEGVLHIVLPYPDYGDPQAHGGKYYLKTEHNDNGFALCEVLYLHEFVVVLHRLDNTREPEIWLTCIKAYDAHQGV